MPAPTCFQANRNTRLSFALLSLFFLLNSPGIAGEPSSETDTARRLIKEHRYKQAETLVSTLLKNSPDDADLHMIQGELLREKGQIDNATSAYARAAELSPSNPYPLIALSELSLRQLELELSLTYAQQAVASDPDCLEARLTLVDVLLQCEQTAEAERQLKYFPEESKGRPEVEILAYRLNQKKGDFVSARKHLMAAISASDKETNLQLRLEACDLLQTLGEYTESKRELEKIIAANPNSLEAHLRLARLLETQFHDYPGALGQYDEALKLDPLSAAAISGNERCKLKRRNIALALKIALREFCEWANAQQQKNH